MILIVFTRFSYGWIGKVNRRRGYYYRMCCVLRIRAGNDDRLHGKTSSGQKTCPSFYSDVYNYWRRDDAVIYDARVLRVIARAHSTGGQLTDIMILCWEAVLPIFFLTVGFLF